MKNINSMFAQCCSKQFVIALFLFVSPIVGAYAACCAGHGGVISCNKTTGFQMCKDGTSSPTCTCPKEPKKKATKPVVTTKQPKTVETAPAATKSTAPATTTKPKSTWWGGKSTTTTTTPASTGSAKGCCSNHGGVASCNKSAGRQMCKDGTTSPTCACH